MRVTRCLNPVLCLLIAVGVTDLPAHAQTDGAPQPDQRLALAEETTLAALVELCAEQLDVRIEYEARALQSETVTVRVPGGIGAQELWPLTNQLLESRGFTTVEKAGGTVLQVVKLNEAGRAARLQHDADAIEARKQDTGAGYVSMITRVEHRPVRDVIDALEPALSQPGGTIRAIGESGLLVISDLRARLKQVMWLLEQIDAPGGDITIRRLDAQYVQATTLGASVTAAAKVRDTLQPKPLQGSLKASSDGASLILVCPEQEEDTWRTLIDQFDQRQAVTTHTYMPRHFAIDEVAGLIEQTAKLPGPRGSGEQWKVTTDSLTNSIHVTATPDEHSRIEQFMQRLADMPAEARRTMKTFAIRNRSVEEVLEVVTGLLEAGALAETPPEVLPPEDGDTTDDERPQAQPMPPLPEGAERGRRVRRDGRGGERRTQRMSGRGTNDETGRAPIRIMADQQTNTLIAVGEPRLVRELGELVKQIDVRQPQVMVEAMVVNLTEAETFDLGVELQKLEMSGNTMIQLASLFGLSDVAANSSELPGVSGSGFTNVVLSPGDFSVVVRALQTINEGRRLARPNVLVNSNENAVLDSVREEPFTSTNASDTVATTSFGGSLSAGTQISVRPQIAHGDHLLLEYSVSLSNFVGESADPNLPPPRQENSLESVATIPDGYTIAVGGLQSENDAEAISQVPLLGEIPILGEAFKSRSRTRDRSRYYVFIRATVLRRSGFEDLKYISEREAHEADVPDGWPEVEPRIIR